MTFTSPSPNGKRAGKPLPRGEGLSSPQHSAQQSPRTTEQHRERISPFSDLSSGLSPGSASSAGATAPSRQPISPLQGQNHPPTVLRLSDVLPPAPCETRLAPRPKAPPGPEDGARAAHRLLLASVSAGLKEQPNPDISPQKILSNSDTDPPMPSPLIMDHAHPKKAHGKASEDLDNGQEKILQDAPNSNGHATTAPTEKYSVNLIQSVTSPQPAPRYERLKHETYVVSETDSEDSLHTRQFGSPTNGHATDAPTVQYSVNLTQSVTSSQFAPRDERRKHGTYIMSETDSEDSLHTSSRNVRVVTILRNPI